MRVAMLSLCEWSGGQPGQTNSVTVSCVFLTLNMIFLLKIHSSKSDAHLFNQTKQRSVNRSESVRWGL